MSKNILIVDDSASMRRSIKVTLAGAGYQTAEAEDGMQALGIARSTAFDLVLTDLNMPVLDGMGLISELRKLPSYKGIPIIFVTTESDAQKKAEAKSKGATGWIVKPFQPDDLVNLARKVLGK